MQDKPYSWAVVLGGILLLVIGSIIYCFYQWAMGPHWMPVGQLKYACVFPLKSGAPTVVPNAQCQYLGAQYKSLCDRVFVVYDRERKVVTARTAPNLMRIKALVSPFDKIITFTTTSGRQPFNVNLNHVALETTSISMKFPTTETEILYTLDCGDDAARWISFELDQDGVRLGYWPEGFGRDIVKARPREVSVFNLNNHIAGAYSNLSSYLLLNEDSVNDLKKRLGRGSTVSVQNFRGNILIFGAKPYAEDRWERLRVGSVTFRIVKPCVRCIMVTIDPKTLLRDPNMEPLRTLKTYRQLKRPAERMIEGDSPVMGAYMCLIVPGEIKVGDPVYAWTVDPKEAFRNIFTSICDGSIEEFLMEWAT